MGSESIKTKLGEICNFSSGSAFPKDYQGQAVGKYPFIKVSDLNISGNERHILGSNNWLDELNFKELGVKLHPKEAVVFAKIGVALTYNRRRILTMDTIIDNNMMSASPLKSHVSPLFFFYLLRTIDFNMYSVGTALPYLNISDLRQITVEIPDMQTQKAIEAVLGSLDDKIELNRQINEKLEGIAQALFKSWFMDFDPVRAKSEGRDTGLPEHISSLFPASFVDSEMGQIPEGWKKTTLGEICHKPQYGYTDSAQVEEIGPKFLRITDINKEAWIDWSKVPYCSPEEEDHVRYRLHMGDIVIARMADPGHGAMIEESIDAVYASYLIRFVPKKKEYSRYLQYWLKSTVYWQIVNARKTGTTRANINAQDMSGFPLLLPPEGILAQFSDKTSSIRDSGIKHIEESSVLRRFRDTLLPKLISGELPIPDAERIVGRYL